MTSDQAGNTVSPDEEPDGERQTVATERSAQPSAAQVANAGDFGAAGAVGVVSAGLGLSSLTGTSLGEMLHSRQEIVGQIEAATGGGDQVEALYGAPWDVAALVNGVFALIAILIGGVVLAALSRQADTRPWVKALAMGGMVLGALGLVVAGGMYFDVFADQPQLPAAPGLGG